MVSMEYVHVLFRRGWTILRQSSEGTVLCKGGAQATVRSAHSDSPGTPVTGFLSMAFSPATIMECSSREPRRTLSGGNCYQLTGCLRTRWIEIYMSAFGKSELPLRVLLCRSAPKGSSRRCGLHEAVRGQFERFDIRASIANNGASLRA
jgi:hypothetical protein